MRDEKSKVVDKMVRLKADVSVAPSMDAANCSDGSVGSRGQH